MLDYQREFIEFAQHHEALRFGEFTLKSGRRSPYFFNAGLFNSGAALAKLGQYYAEAIRNSGIAYDMLFGPAYKGIALAASTAIALAQYHGRDVPYCFNRKEAKDHGEGGTLVGAPLKGRVLIIDDVISAGTSVRESIAMICAAGAEPAGIAMVLDRQERGRGTLSAAQEVHSEFGIPCVSIATLADLLDYLQTQPLGNIDIEAIRRYRDEYGV